MTECSECESKEVRCKECNNLIGWFDGKVAKRNDGIHIADGVIYFTCSKCNAETEVCKNNFNVRLEH